MVDGLGAGAGAVPVPLRRLEGRGSVVVRALAEGTAAQIVDLLDVVRVQVSDAIPPDAVAGVAEHCYATHRRACRTSTCSVARAMVASPRAEVTSASA
jgi:hypothetical protein